MHPAEFNPKRRPHQAEYAAFGAYRSSAHPIRAVKGGTQQVTGSDHTAVRHGVEEGLAPIPGGVKAHSKPEIARAAQGQTEEQSDECRSQQSSPLLSLILEVNQSEHRRQDDCRRPEADTARERELGAAAQEKFLE